ncbi:MAG TPA: hypothetical protein PLU35_13800 [Phycisphaerales bacterium]|nr:hypothetical protein [Phycisphaerales bacterium]
MRTTEAELRSEAAICAEGTGWHGHELAAEYVRYANLAESRGEIAEDFRHWWSVVVLDAERDEMQRWLGWWIESHRDA